MTKLIALYCKKKQQETKILRFEEVKNVYVKEILLLVLTYFILISQSIVNGLHGTLGKVVRKAVGEVPKKEQDQN